MKDRIHPQCMEIQASCACGNLVKIWSVLKHDISLDVCNACHPFYTGKQRVIDTRGRVNRFNKKFGMSLVSKK